jgi:hypothetical protein
MGRVELQLTGSQNGGLNQNQVVVVGQAAEKPYEWLLKLIVALGRDIVILEILLAVEGDLLGLDLAVLDVDLVSDQDDGDVLADTREILVPLGHVGVGDARAHVEHDHGAVAADVVAVSQTTELLLAGGVPHVEPDLAVVGEEGHGVDLHAEGRDVLLFELAGQVALHEGGLAHASVANKHELEFRDLLLVYHLKSN